MRYYRRPESQGYGKSLDYWGEVDVYLLNRAIFPINVERSGGYGTVIPFLIGAGFHIAGDMPSYFRAASDIYSLKLSGVAYPGVLIGAEIILARSENSQEEPLSLRRY